jgi:hypothetical protein
LHLAGGVRQEAARLVPAQHDEPEHAPRGRFEEDVDGPPELDAAHPHGQLERGRR